MQLMKSMLQTQLVGVQFELIYIFYAFCSSRVIRAPHTEMYQIDVESL